MQSKVTLKYYIDEVLIDEEILKFENSKDLRVKSQYHRIVNRLNRLLPIGHRFRGDVCA